MSRPLPALSISRGFDRTRSKPDQLRSCVKIGLGSGFNDHRLLQYQLSSSPEYAYSLIKPKGCRNGRCKKLIGRLQAHSWCEYAGLLRSRVVILWLVLVSASYGTPAVLATGIQTQPHSGPATVVTTDPDVVAAVDSKGRVHAAWVE
jgi:hypothetical protein